MSDFNAIHEHLLTYATPLLPPSKPHERELSNAITSLRIHPSLEAGLHLLNLDLASAHFLVRHMQSPPAYEGMYLHGILHRIEGDYINARMWYSDVQKSEVYQKVWGKEGITFKQTEKGEGSWEEMDAGQRFLNDVQKFKGTRKQDERHPDLENESKRELETVIKWCVEKFGIDSIEDATEAWVRPGDDIKKMGEDQVSGPDGRREF